MPFALSNLIPISDEFHWQYEQHRMKGPAGWPLAALSGAASRFGSAVVSRETVVRWPTQMGHWKQLRVHLQRDGCQQHGSQSVCHQDRENWGTLPVAFALDVATRHLKQTGRAVESHNLLGHAAWTSYLVAVLAVEQVLQRVQTVVGSGRPRVEGALLVFLLRVDGGARLPGAC